MKYGIAVLVAFCLLGNVTGLLAQNKTWSPEVLERIEKHADSQVEHWKNAAPNVPQKFHKAIEFQLQHMPPIDLKKLDMEFLLENTRLAYQAWEAAPWKEQISEEQFFNDILPYANIDETRESWRQDFFDRFAPLIAECRTPGEAAQVLNKQVFNAVGVHYSTQRKKANQSPSESISQGKASCTGLSILLVDACRSVGVPARLAGIPSWVNKRGNHTWVEVWDQGQWHFTGADEPDDRGLDHAWFQGDAKLARKDETMHSIYAVSFRTTDTRFPMVWSRDGQRTVHAVNVTDRYTGNETVVQDGRKLRVRLWDAARKSRIVAAAELSCLQCIDDEPLRGQTRGNRTDMNDLLEFPVQVGRTYELKLKVGDETMTREVKLTSDQDRLLELEWAEDRE